ncbi:MAG: RagB/SusD family nutrient uptake outer membrane protein [Leadbetterella sp.]|nr:RagB/SusD family nutrient uptake outer membrane protein [Leadbetterella sp.]
MKVLIKRGLILGVIGISGISCDSKLDLMPHQSIDETTALATSQDVIVTLNGAYDGASSINLYGGAIQYMGDLLGDDGDVRFGGSYATLDELWRKTMTTNNTQIQATWLQAYSTINRINNVLAAIDKVAESERDEVEAKALFLRGLTYFDLVRLWGKDFSDGTNTSNPGVPLVTEPTKVVTEADARPRASVAAVYTQAISDLTRAVSLFSGDPVTGFGSKEAAQAILARIYLQQGNYAGARDAANAVIESGNFSLAGSFADAFKDASPETIFSIVVTEQDGTNDLNTFYAPASYQGRGDIRVQPKFLALYSEKDTRGTFFVRASNNTFSGKFLDRFGDVLVVRLAEMYLIRAEANQRLGTATGNSPLNDVNAIRTRAGAAELKTVNLETILAERKLELAFEGQQVFDAKRLKKNIGSLPYNAPSLVLPIPLREMDSNKSLTQNEGYN